MCWDAAGTRRTLPGSAHQLWHVEQEQQPAVRGDTGAANRLAAQMARQRAHTVTLLLRHLPLPMPSVVPSSSRTASRSFSGLESYPSISESESRGTSSVVVTSALWSVEFHGVSYTDTASGLFGVSEPASAQR